MTQRTKRRNRALAAALVTALAAAIVVGTPTSASAADPENWAVPTNLADPAFATVSPHITARPDGSLTAIWSRWDGTHRRVETSHSANGGATWSAPQILSAAGADALEPRIVSGPAGELIALWRRSDGAQLRIETSRSLDGLNWVLPAVALSEAGGDVSAGELVVAPDGAVTAIWLRNNGSTPVLQTRRSTDSGASWGPAADISDGSGIAAEPQIAVGVDGSLTVVWREVSRVLVSRSVDAVTWNTPVVIFDGGASSNSPVVAAAPDGTLTAVWYSVYGAYNNVHASHSADGVNWSPPATLDDGGRAALFPQMTIASDNTRVVVWQRPDGINTRVQAVHSSDGLTWSGALSISGIGQNATGPMITSSPGGAIAVWHRSDGTNLRIESSSFDGTDSSWSAPVAISPAGGDANRPTLTVAPDGTAAVVWYWVGAGGRAPQVTFSMSAPNITSPPPPAPTLGSAYSFQVTASGNPRPTFAITAGALPAGLAMSTAGLITGTPTTVGSSTFTVTASNGVAPNGSATYTLAIAAAGSTTPPGAAVAELAASGSDPLPLVIAGFATLALGAMMFGGTGRRLRNGRID